MAPANLLACTCTLIWSLGLILVQFASAERTTSGGAHRRPPPPKVLVIGAGVSGLIAATKLHETGKFQVLVLEASDRIGGGYVEMGAQWIHGQKGNSIYELVNPLKIVIHGFDRPKQFALPNGDILNTTTADLINHREHLIEEEPEEFDDKNLSERDARLESKGSAARKIYNKYTAVYPIHEDATIRESALDWINRFLTGDSGAENWFVQSNSREGDQFLACEGDQSNGWKAPYSYSYLLPLILNGRLTDELEVPNWIKLNTEVSQIKYHPQFNTVKITTTKGHTYIADHVIFTPSLGVLKGQHETLFQPPLSKEKRLAIENLGFGSVIKLFLEFDKPWWPADFNGVNPLWNEKFNSSLDYWRLNITLDELLEEYNGVPLWARSIMMMARIDSRSDMNMFELWSTGMPARFIEIMDLNYVIAELMKLLRMFMGKRFHIPEPTNLYRSTWFTNPHTRGTYSYRSTFSEIHVWARDLAVPILSGGNEMPLICFAGEATHPHYFSTVHGAFDSGVREFHRIKDWSDFLPC